ncbi:MAG: hypothetical protein ABIP51_03265 [Bacteroidia bacterium]
MKGRTSSHHYRNTFVVSSGGGIETDCKQLKTINIMSNHLDAPIKLTWTGTEYKVNKPNVESCELVDKDIAVALMCACHNALLDVKKINEKMKTDGLHEYSLMETELQAAIDYAVGRNR